MGNCHIITYINTCLINVYNVCKINIFFEKPFFFIYFGEHFNYLESTI